MYCLCYHLITKELKTNENKRFLISTIKVFQDAMSLDQFFIVILIIILYCQRQELIKIFQHPAEDTSDMCLCCSQKGSKY